MLAQDRSRLVILIRHLASEQGERITVSQMKIYSDKITTADIFTAFRLARTVHGQDIHLDGGVRQFRPRRQAHGYEIFAESMHGKRASAHGPIGSYDRSTLPRAASWNAYGFVIAHLYNVDPDARIGFYAGRADFIAKTATAYGRVADDFLATLRASVATSDTASERELRDPHPPGIVWQV